MAEMNDYSSPDYKDNLKLEDFSKEFLVKLARQYQAAFARVTEIYHDLIQKEVGQERADALERTLFSMQAKANVPRMAKAANIEVKDLVDAWKVLQLLLDGIMGHQPLNRTEIVEGDRNHIIWTCDRCLPIEYYEKQGQLDRIKAFCHDLEEGAMREYILALFPDAEVKVKYHKRPPREGPDDIFCKWEIRLVT